MYKCASVPVPRVAASGSDESAHTKNPPARNMRSASNSFKPSAGSQLSVGRSMSKSQSQSNESNRSTLRKHPSCPSFIGGCWTLCRAIMPRSLPKILEGMNDGRSEQHRWTLWCQQQEIEWVREVTIDGPVHEARSAVDQIESLTRVR